MNWTNLWIKLFGTTTWFNIDIGFWISMGISALVAILMAVIFLSMKPFQNNRLKIDKDKNDQK